LVQKTGRHCLFRGSRWGANSGRSTRTHLHRTSVCPLHKYTRTPPPCKSFCVRERRHNHRRELVVVVCEGGGLAKGTATVLLHSMGLYRLSTIFPSRCATWHHRPQRRALHDRFGQSYTFRDLTACSSRPDSCLQKWQYFLPCCDQS